MSNWVIGYPRPDVELDHMVEADAGKRWAEQQVVIPEIKPLTEEQWVNADAAGQVAEGCLENALGWIATFMERLGNLPESDKVASIYDTISDLKYDFKEIRKGLKH